MQKRQQWVAVPQLHSTVVGEPLDAELWGKKAAENAGCQKRRRGGEKDRGIDSCPKVSVPHRVKSTRKATFVAPSSMTKTTYSCCCPCAESHCIVCRSTLSQSKPEQQPMLGSSRRRTGMEIFYLSRCCRRSRANAKQPLLVLAKPGPHPAEISQWPLLVPFDTYPDRYHLQNSYKGNQENDEQKVILVHWALVMVLPIQYWDLGPLLGQGPSRITVINTWSSTPSRTMTTVSISRTRSPCDSWGGACVCVCTIWQPSPLTTNWGQGHLLYLHNNPNIPTW